MAPGRRPGSTSSPTPARRPQRPGQRVPDGRRGRVLQEGHHLVGRAFTDGWQGRVLPLLGVVEGDAVQPEDR
eukprot:11551782-Alexandrium_andersonii.AAC.1